MASPNKRNQRAKAKKKAGNLERARKHVGTIKKSKIQYQRDSQGTLIQITPHPNGMLVERAPEHMQ